jgi:hypothetical protein
MQQNKYTAQTEGQSVTNTHLALFFFPLLPGMSAFLSKNKNKIKIKIKIKI